MSITEQAAYEMRRAGFADADITAMMEILTIFFSRWNSGGAVWAMVPVLQKCVTGAPLTPLTGDEDEWRNVTCDPECRQNVRCSSVFSQGGRAYDIDNRAWNGVFPYSPTDRNLDPVATVSTSS
jgi:hypothetical protein